MKFLWRGPFRTDTERDEAITELQEMMKKMSKTS